MADLTFNKLADAPVLDEVPDGAKVYAEVDGKVYRVAGDNLGGGVPTAIIELTVNGVALSSLTDADKPVATAAEGESTEETAVTENEATPPAAGIAKGIATYNVSDTYTGVCTNMTYDKAKALLEAGKPLMAVIVNNDNSSYIAMLAGFVIYSVNEEIIQLYVDSMYLHWLPDDTISLGEDK